MCCVQGCITICMFTQYSINQSILNVSSSFSWLFSSYRVTGVTDDLPNPCHHVHLLSRSQSRTFRVSLACVFPSCIQLFSLALLCHVCSQHFPQYVIFVSPRQGIITFLYQFNRLSVIFLEACATLIVPRMCSFPILSLHATPHIHHSIPFFVRLSCFLLLRCSSCFCLVYL